MFENLIIFNNYIITFSVFSQYITTPINYRLNPLQVSQPFSKPLASPASSVLALLYTFPHIPVVCRLLYASNNFGESYLFFHLFFVLLPQAFVFILRLQVRLFISHKGNTL